MRERAGSVNKPRTYHVDGYTQRAGCLCFKTDRGKEVLLVTSNRYPDKWIVPAGGVETGEEFQDAAVREVEEEAGVRGNIVQCLGMFQNETSKTRTMMYILHVTEKSVNTGRTGQKGEGEDGFQCAKPGIYSLTGLVNSRTCVKP